MYDTDIMTDSTKILTIMMRPTHSLPTSEIPVRWFLRTGEIEFAEFLRAFEKQRGGAQETWLLAASRFTASEKWPKLFKFFERMK